MILFGRTDGANSGMASRLRMASTFVYECALAEPGEQSTRGDITDPAGKQYLVFHYERPEGDYAGWGLYVFGDVDSSEQTDWPTLHRFTTGESDAAVAVRLQPDATDVGFIVAKGGIKEHDHDRHVDPRKTSEVWLKQNDPTVYRSQFAAKGYARVHYRRPSGDYGGWGLYAFGDIHDDDNTTWPAAHPFEDSDAFGRFVDVKIVPHATRVGIVIVGNGEKDVEAESFFDPDVHSEVWLCEDDPMVYHSPRAAYSESRPPVVVTGHERVTHLRQRMASLVSVPPQSRIPLTSGPTPAVSVVGSDIGVGMSLDLAVGRIGWPSEPTNGFTPVSVIVAAGPHSVVIAAADGTGRKVGSDVSSCLVFITHSEETTLRLGSSKDSAVVQERTS
jgi:Bacterial pullanase-associated domain